MATRPCSVNDLSDEIISNIIYQLADPGPLSMTSKRFYQISKDPYVRSSYFLSRYGPQQAFYWALGRGKLVNNRVLDILFTSGAHLSRYLLQTAIHHYFRTTSHFMKYQWARTLPLPVFTHFLSLHRYGSDVPLAKGEDDGSIFMNWLKEKVNPGQVKKVELEVIRDLFVKYGFMIFSPKDPISCQLPLAFALEPTLLPLAVANGFHMDSKYRDFIFRKMFENRSPRVGRIAEIIRNVQEMTSLDKRMFLSRTVAAEVCMECRVNDAGYIALKRLDADGALLFSLKDLVNDLLQLFLKTRSITNQSTVNTLQTLYRDFSPDYPTSGPRLVMLITVFRAVSSSNSIFNDSDQVPTHKNVREKLDALGLLPLTRSDLVDLLTSAWCEKPRSVFAWADEEMRMTHEQLRTLAEEVAVKSLTISSKGKFLRRIVDRYPSVKGHISAAMKEYRFDLDSLPDYWANDDCTRFRTNLNTSLGFSDIYTSWVNRGDFMDDESNDESDSDDDEREQPFTIEEDGKISKGDLGSITQDTLSTRIQMDTENSLRFRRRYWHNTRYLITTDTQQKLPFPADALHIGKWVLSEYGPRDPVVAVFMTHAIVNGNIGVIQQYLEDDVPRPDHVPITLKHFKILARLGIEPYWQLWKEIEHSEFFFSEDDYLEPGRKTTTNCVSLKTKLEDRTPEFESKAPFQSTVPAVEHSNLRKRPRRSTAAAPSYVVPDSDDDAIAEESADLEYPSNRRKSKGKGRAESDLQLWIKHLTILLKEEEKKYKEKKKTIEKNESGKPKHRLPKSDFMKSVASRLRDLRASERQQRRDEAPYFRRNGGKLTDSDCASVGSDDEEFVLRQPRPKRRRTEVSRLD